MIRLGQLRKRNCECKTADCAQPVDCSEGLLLQLPALTVLTWLEALTAGLAPREGSTHALPVSCFPSTSISCIQLTDVVVGRKTSNLNTNKIIIDGTQVSAVIEGVSEKQNARPRA